MDVDKRVEEVESASGEKMVRAAHVPVPSQVFFISIKVKSEVEYMYLSKFLDFFLN